MILVDSNLLIYAHSKRSPQHAAARTWLDDRLNRPGAVGLPWMSLLAFVRIVTNPRVAENPESISDAWLQVREWLGRRNVWIPQPGEQHAEIIGKLLMNSGFKANLVPDAHLAALALEHGLTLCSADGDFARFPGLNWLNPLA